MAKDTDALADLGGACPVHGPPMGPNSFVFTYIFTEKCPRRRSMPPLMGARPPREILDPPLRRTNSLVQCTTEQVQSDPLNSNSLNSSLSLNSWGKFENFETITIDTNVKLTF